jgi:hypothetical protein
MRSPAGVCLAALVLGPAVALGQAKAPEYDVASEVTLRGEVSAIHESKVATDHPGLHLILQTEEGAVEVHACPVRFLRELDFTIEIGDTLSIVGSRPRKSSVVVAREITKGSMSLILRDKNGVPNWTPRGPGR